MHEHAETLSVGILSPSLKPQSSLSAINREASDRKLASVSTPTVIRPVVSWAFYAFLFSLLFEAAPIGIPFEITSVTGIVLVVAAALFQPSLCFQTPPSAFWWFACYLWIGISILAFYHELFDVDVILRQFKFLQLIVLFWISYNIMRDDRTAKGALGSLVASSTFLSVLSLLGLTTSTEQAVSKLERLTAFGLDSNQLGGALALGILCLVGLAYGLNHVSFRGRLVIWLPAAVIAMTIVKTGSRGALLSLGVGLLVFTLRKGSLFSKLRNGAVVIVGLGFFFWIASQSEMVQHRFRVALEEGNMSEREEVYPLAWQMFVERPIFGWGPMVNTRELGNRLQNSNHERMDAHNLILSILTATGIVGALPFLVGVGLCARASWRARKGSRGVVPLVLTVCLLTADMSVSGYFWKQHWLVLAYGLASASQFGFKTRRHFSCSMQAEPNNALV